MTGLLELRSAQRSRLVLGGRAPRRAIDLSDGAHVVGEVRDTARHLRVSDHREHLDRTIVNSQIGLS
jgi:hypothetical protein